MSALRPGQAGILCKHAHARRLRLRELGLVPGTRVELVRRAPLGDPIEVELRGYRLCLRRIELEGLCVVPEQRPPQ